MKLSKVQTVFSKNRFTTQNQKLKILPISPGEYSFALIYAYKIDFEKYKKVVSSLIKKNFFVISVSPNIPEQFIDSNRVIHIQVHPRFMGLLTFTNSSFLKVNCVLGLDSDGEIEAQRVSSHFNIQLIKCDELGKIRKRKVVKINSSDETNYKILFDTNYEASNRGLGDILMTTAIVKQIRKNYPNASIILSSRPEAKIVFEGNINIDELKVDKYNKSEFEETLENYDKHYFLGKMTEDYTNERNRQPRIDSMAQLFGLELESKTPELFLTNNEIEKAKEIVDTTKYSIVFCFEAIGTRRRISNGILFEILSKIKKENYNVFVVGKHRLSLPRWIHNLTGKTSLRELFAVISLSNLVVTADNFVSHVAAAFNKKEIILYTTIPSEWRCKYYRYAVPIQSKIECSPCWNCFRFDDRKCKGDEKCVESFDVDSIVKKIKNVSSSKRVPVEKIFENLIDSKVVNQKDESQEKSIENEKKSILIKMPNGELGDKLVVMGLISEMQRKYKDYKIDVFVQSERYNGRDGYCRLFDDCVNKCFTNLRDIDYFEYGKILEISAYGIHDDELNSVIKGEIQLSRYQRWAKQLGFIFNGQVNANYIVKENDCKRRRGIPRFDFSKRPIIGIAPLTSNRAKNWSADFNIQFDKWQQVINYLNSKGCNILTLHHYPLKHKNCINFGNLKPRELGGVISKLDLLIGCEAGVTHFAGILKIPMIVLVGSSSPIVLRHYNNVRVLHFGECYSCNRFISMTFDKCKCGQVSQHPNSDCLTAISVNNVIDEVRDFKSSEFKQKYNIEL